MFRRYHIEDPRNPKNELKYNADDLGNYAILSNSIVPLEEKVQDSRVDEILVDPKFLQSFFLLHPKYESLGQLIAPKISRENE